MSIPVFINLESNNQLDELRSYLASKGIDVERPASDDLDLNLNQIIKASDGLWTKSISEYDLEMVMNSIISMVVVMPRESVGGPVGLLCTSLRRPLPPPDKKNASKLKLLNNLFAGLEDASPLRYTVYLALVHLAGQADLLHLVNIRLSAIRDWVAQWGVGTQKHHELLRHLHASFLHAKQTEKACRVMIELLCTYSKQDAASAQEDARRCIVACIADPAVLLLDSLLLSEPVKFLEGEPIHDLLSLFVVGRLRDYDAFEQRHGVRYVEEMGLKSADNVHKMRLLTFCSLAEASSELTFATLATELRFEESEVELFLSEVLRSKVAQVRIEEPKKKVYVQSSTQRTFGMPQWMRLHQLLEGWRGSLEVMAGSLNNVAAAAAVAAA